MQSIYVLAWRYVRQSPLRSLLSMAAVALGVAVSISGGLIVNSVQAGLRSTAEMEELMGGSITSIIEPAMQFVGLTVILASGFLIFNTFGMTITQRRQQIGMLRALGMTRPQIRRLILAEALLLALVGVVLGLLLSQVMGPLLVAAMRHAAGEMMGFEDASPDPLSLILAPVAAVLVTLAAVLLPAQRAARATPLEALRPTEADDIAQTAPWRWMLGVALLGLVLAVDLFDPPGAWAIYPTDLLLTSLFALLWLTGLVALLPGIIGLVTRTGRRWLPGAAGRLISDNLARARARVTLTVTTLMFALLIMISLTGFVEFFLMQGLFAILDGVAKNGDLMIARVSVSPDEGLGSVGRRNLDTVLMSDAEVEAALRAGDTYGSAIPIRIAVVHETSLLGPSYFSQVIEPSSIEDVIGPLFTFVEGSWEEAMPVMEQGCGLLVVPVVAVQLGADLGDEVRITGADGPVSCTLVGIGTSAGGTSIIGTATPQIITPRNPMYVYVKADDPSLAPVLLEAMTDAMAQYPELRISTLMRYGETVHDMVAVLNVSTSLMLMLALLAGGFGVVNTMMMSVDERRQEYGLLRALGTSQAQMRRIIVGEAALLGVIGGVVGFFGGLGLVVVMILTFGMNSLGLQLDLWATVGLSLPPALLTGLAGLLAAPIIALLSAWLPARTILRADPVGLLPRSR